MAFGGLGGTEILVIIIVIIILFFGARKIPELAKGLGRAMGEFKRGRSEVEREMAQDAARATQKENKAQAPAPREPAPAAAAVVDSEIVKAARALGIETEGKTEEQLKKEIAEAMKQGS